MVDKLSKQDIMKICFQYNILHYTINSDMSVDVDEHVDLTYKNLYKIPLNFRKVYGDFICSSNSLTSLEGCPEYVSDSFSCYNNNLTSLKGCPKYVGGYFNCSRNKLTSLDGISTRVNRYFNCTYSGLSRTSILEFYVGGNIYNDKPWKF